MGGVCGKYWSFVINSFSIFCPKALWKPLWAHSEHVRRINQVQSCHAWGIQSSLQKMWSETCTTCIKEAHVCHAKPVPAEWAARRLYSLQETHSERSEVRLQRGQEVICFCVFEVRLGPPRLLLRKDSALTHICFQENLKASERSRWHDDEDEGVMKRDS